MRSEIILKSEIAKCQFVEGEKRSQFGGRDLAEVFDLQYLSGPARVSARAVSLQSPPLTLRIHFSAKRRALTLPLSPFLSVVRLSALLDPLARWCAQPTASARTRP